MQKILAFIFMSVVFILFACGGAESDPGEAPPPISSAPPAENAAAPALSKENKRLFYETMNIRNINYRRRLKAIMDSDGNLAQSPAIEATLALLSNSTFDEEVYQKAFAAYFEPFKSGAKPELTQAFYLTCHSYLDRIVGNNTNGLSQVQLEGLQGFVEEIKMVGMEPSEILASWNSAQLEEITDLPVVASIDELFN